MKAIHHKKTNTIDLVGLTPEQGYILTSLVGSATTPEGLGENPMTEVFSELKTLVGIGGFVDYPSLYTGLHKLTGYADKMHEDLINRGFYPKPKATKPADLRRAPNGHFLPKKWVARFAYRGEKDWGAHDRQVVTNLTGRGKTRPSLVPLDIIEGYDVDREAYRQFKVSRIVGKVSWSREYVEG